MTATVVGSAATFSATPGAATRSPWVSARARVTTSGKSSAALSSSIRIWAPWKAWITSERKSPVSAPWNHTVTCGSPVTASSVSWGPPSRHAAPTSAAAARRASQRRIPQPLLFPPPVLGSLGGGAAARPLEALHVAPLGGSVRRHRGDEPATRRAFPLRWDRASIIDVARTIIVLALAGLVTACSAGSPADPGSAPSPTGDPERWREAPGQEPYPFVTPIPPLAKTPVDGVYRRNYPGGSDPIPCRRCAPYRLDRGEGVLTLQEGRFSVDQPASAFRSGGHFFVDGPRLILINDP